MTVLEFEAWVSDHYSDLVSQATAASRGSDAAVDLLHRLVESLLERPEKIAEFDPARLMGWFNVELRHDFLNTITVQQNEARNLARIGGWIEVLGQGDTFADTRRAAEARAKRRMREKANGIQPAGYGVEIEIDGFPRTAVRWRRQQIRDNRLFDERAIRSLADSMHRASARYRHYGEHGLSYTEFGKEVAR